MSAPREQARGLTALCGPVSPQGMCVWGGFPLLKTRPSPCFQLWTLTGAVQVTRVNQQRMHWRHFCWLNRQLCRPREGVGPYASVSYRCVTKRPGTWWLRTAFLSHGGTGPPTGRTDDVGARGQVLDLPLLGGRSPGTARPSPLLQSPRLQSRRQRGPQSSEDLKGTNLPAPSLGVSAPVP